MERNVTLCRVATSDQGTEGILLVGQFSCKTIELPWRDNEVRISCIPPGVYDAETRVSNRYGKTYWVRHVPERTYILIHSGNLAGDKAMGFKSDAMGCILLGERHGDLYGQRAVLSSRVTMKKFMKEMNDEKFKLNVVESY